MCYLKMKLMTGLLVVSAVLTIAQADTSASRLSLEQGWDSADGRDYFAQADIDLVGPRLYLGYGETDATSGATVLDTVTRQIGISSDPRQDMGAGLSYSDWGQDGEINILTWRVDFTYNTENWRFTLAPQRRRIELYTLLVIRRPVIDMDSDGLNLAVDFYGADPFYMGVSYSTHDYSRNISAFADDPRLALLFSPASLEYVYGFEKRRLSGTMGIGFDWGSVGIDAYRSESGVDDSISTVVALSLSYDFNLHWGMDVRAGRSDNSFSTETTTFASLAAGYRF